MTTATAVAVPCQHDGCEAETLATVAGEHVTGYRPGCQHHQAWGYVETTAREQMAEAGPVKGAEGRPAGATEGEPPAEVVRAVKEAILEETGYRPAARDLTDEQCARIARAALEAVFTAAWDMCPNKCRAQGFGAPCGECIQSTMEEAP